MIGRFDVIALQIKAQQLELQTQNPDIQTWGYHDLAWQSQFWMSEACKANALADGNSASKEQLMKAVALAMFALQTE